MIMTFERTLTFKKFKLSIIYFNGQFELTILKPSAYFIIESEKSFHEMKNYENIEEIDGNLYLMHYDGKTILGKIRIMQEMIQGKITMPFTGYTGWSGIYRYGNCKDNTNKLYKLILYTPTYDRWIPISPIKLYKYITHQNKIQ